MTARFYRMHTIRFWLSIGLLLALPAMQAAAQPVLSASPPDSSDGVSVISWQAPAADQHIILQRATHADFSDARQIYRGSDTASTVTGMTDGTWYFRARLDDGAWSEPLAVKVQHHPLGRAFGFFSVGAIVFIGTVWLIVGGSRRQRSRQ